MTLFTVTLNILLFHFRPGSKVDTKSVQVQGIEMALLYFFETCSTKFNCTTKEL